MRISIVILFVIAELFSFPTNYKQICFTKDTNTILVYISSKLEIVGLLPLIFRSMFIYQSIFIFMIILVLFNLKRMYYSLRKLKDRIVRSTLYKKLNTRLANSNSLSKIKPSSKIINFINKKHITILGSVLLVFIVTSSVSIEFNRFSWFNTNGVAYADYLTQDVRDMADYISNNFEGETFYVESRNLAMQLSALCPTNNYLPTQSNYYAACLY